MLLKILLKAGAHDQIATLLRRDPAARGSLDDAPIRTVPSPLKSLLESLQEAGAREQATALAERLPGQASSTSSASNRTAGIGSGLAGRLMADRLSRGTGTIWTDGLG